MKNIKNRIIKLEEKMGTGLKERIINLISFSNANLPSVDEQISEQRKAGKHFIVVSLPYQKRDV